MFPVSCLIIFTFDPDLKIHFTIIERSFGHDLNKLTEVNYLNRGIFSSSSSVAINQLREVIKVSKKSHR